MIFEGKNRNEFTSDVLAALIRKKVRFRGCDPHHVEMALTGEIKVTFSGYRDAKPWQGKVEFSCRGKKENLFLTDPDIVADVCRQGIEAMKADL
ncbi:MAG: hypothetical protein KGL39_24315 [Patescibacteria group bacterium]|nr:hypothetical protein [Patescibacteria group bacterium]